MASKTALPIARLRALGCRVHTIIGHDPSIGDWKYGVTLPDTLKGDTLFVEAQSNAMSTRGVASVSISPVRDDRRLIVKACLYRVREPLPSKAEREQAERDVASLLSALADVLTGRDPS